MAMEMEWYGVVCTAYTHSIYSHTIDARNDDDKGKMNNNKK